MANCPSCGANVSIRDETCSYCGTQNPEYQSPRDEVNVLLEKGMRFYQQKEYVLATDCYRQAIDLDPDVFIAYFYLATSLVALGRREDAIKAMKKAQEIRPGSTAAYYNLGLLSRQLGRKDEAQEYLEKALKMVESDVSIQDHKQMKQNIEKELDTLK